MGFHLEINSIVRTDDIPSNLKEGDTISFKNEGSRVYFDNIPIWLVRRDWTAVAEIQIVGQTRSDGKFETGKYRVLHIYTGEESKQMTLVFRRMYGWD